MNRLMSVTFYLQAEDELELIKHFYGGEIAYLPREGECVRFTTNELMKVVGVSHHYNSGVFDGV